MIMMKLKDLLKLQSDMSTNYLKIRVWKMKIDCRIWQFNVFYMVFYGTIINTLSWITCKRKIGINWLFENKLYLSISTNLWLQTRLLESQVYTEYSFKGKLPCGYLKGLATILPNEGIIYARKMHVDYNVIYTERNHHFEENKSKCY